MTHSFLALSSSASCLSVLQRLTLLIALHEPVPLSFDIIPFFYLSSRPSLFCLFIRTLFPTFWMFFLYFCQGSGWMTQLSLPLTLSLTHSLSPSLSLSLSLTYTCIDIYRYTVYIHTYIYTVYIYICIHIHTYFPFQWFVCNHLLK